MNKKINKNIINYFYFKTKQYKNILFQRRLSLYFDTLKVLSLLYAKQIHVSGLLHLLALLFKHLSKKLHQKFIQFIKIIVYSLVSNENKKDYRSEDTKGNLQGIKFRINGKLKGAMRASTYLITYGKIPNQSISKAIEYSKAHTYTRYGAFGLHIWLNKF